VLRRACVAVIAVAIIACPLSATAYLAPTSALAQRQIGTVPPVSPNIPTPIGETGPIPTPLPTLEPGQYFESDDPNKPPVDPDSIVGDLKFGYGRSEDNPDLYVVWMTDQNGTHYLTVHKDSEILSGGSDPAGGFIDLVRERERIRADIDLAVANQATERRARDRFAGGAFGAAAIGLACVAITAGTCLAFVGVAAAAVWLSLSKDTETELIQNQIDRDQKDLSQIEGNLRFGFRVGQTTEAEP